MIRLVFATDDGNTIGFKNPADNPKRFAAWPEGTQEELGKTFYGDDVAVGSNTYDPFFVEYGSDENKVFVLSRTGNVDLKGNPHASIVNDYKELVEKYKDSDKVLLIPGGKITWELFLPYADELVVVYFDNELPGDIIFDSWRDVKRTVVSSRKWNGGTTTVYKVEK